MRLWNAKWILRLTLIGSCLVISGVASAQTRIDETNEIDGRSRGGTRNILHPAVPLLSIAPDSRSSAMGDAGVASEPDVFSQHWNSAKYALIPKQWGVAIS